MIKTPAADIITRNFTINSEQDLAKAEQYQQRMYNKYNSVEVYQLNGNTIAIQCTDKV